MKLHRVKDWKACGPTAFASLFGITRAEAEEHFKKLRKQKRGIRSITILQFLKLSKRFLKARGIKGEPYYIELMPDEKVNRPHVREEHELNVVARKYRSRGWVPVAIVSGTIQRNNHMMAYDHRRKFLCDSFSCGKRVRLQDHPKKHTYLWGVVVFPKEFLDG